METLFHIKYLLNLNYSESIKYYIIKCARSRVSVMVIQATITIVDLVKSDSESIILI